MSDLKRAPDAQMRLVIFDVDGTLSDSQLDIIGSMTDAFVAEELTVPTRHEILGIVGLSLEVAMPLLAPEVPDATIDRLVAAYKAAYMQRRLDAGAAHSPLYPGVRDLVEALAAEPGISDDSGRRRPSVETEPVHDPRGVGRNRGRSGSDRDGRGYPIRYRHGQGLRHPHDCCQLGISPCDQAVARRSAGR